MSTKPFPADSCQASRVGAKPLKRSARTCLVPVTLAATLTAGLLAADTAHAQTVLYEELFPNSSTTAGKNFSTANIGWSANTGSGATDQNTASPTSSSPAAIWYTAGQDGDIGYAFSAGSSIGLFWTAEFVSLELSAITNLSFYYNNSTTTTQMRAAVRLDNNTPLDTSDDFWVATNSSFVRTSGTAGSGSPSNFATNGELASFAIDGNAATWRNLTFTSGTTLSLAGTARTADLPGGNVTAAGILFTGTGGVRADTFSITAVPEPSAIMLGAGAMLGWAGLARRRK